MRKGCMKGSYTGKLFMRRLTDEEAKIVVDSLIS